MFIKYTTKNISVIARRKNDDEAVSLYAKNKDGIVISSRKDVFFAVSLIFVV